MINLAGVKICNETIEKELKTAGIEIVRVGRMDNEVPSSILGKCNNFIFRRAWYYWIVTGYMPLQYAEELYAKYKVLDIRVVGHCGNPPPKDWCEPRNFREKCKPFVDRYLNKEITAEEVDKLCNEIRKQGEQFITHYDIDTQEGLNRFVEIVKNNNIIG